MLRANLPLRILELLALLLDELDQVLVDVGEVLALVLLVDLLIGLLAADALLRDHDDAGGPLGAAGGAELGARRHEDVRHVDVLAQHRDVADDVHRADVAREDHDARERRVARPGRRRLAQRLDHFFHAALEGLVLGRCGFEGWLVLRSFPRWMDGTRMCMCMCMYMCVCIEKLKGQHTFSYRLHDLLGSLLVGERQGEGHQGAYYGSQDLGGLAVGILHDGDGGGRVGF